ncbi:SMP-30/gluconolactonase/LRE family protein [Acinetobacter johnsonii]|uniref:SMP-30/gluconolactonase/LRE family protein n=1 Tax=Acinetobacter johnsonii TaxID=40214 RepID=UPI001F34622A|nr:SMP-30/gluconolactonase/LRE family protein [Acinetobacter johnsonii]
MSKLWSEFRLHKEDFSSVGQGLTRPECVLCDEDGIWVSDSKTGGVARVEADGPHPLGEGLRVSNGFSRRPDGSFVIVGLEDHTVSEISLDGVTKNLLDQIEGKSLGVVNYPCLDAQGRIWVSVMTHRERWCEAFNTGQEGSIFLIENGQARVVADGLHMTNEVKVSPDGKYLYASESLGCRIVRFPILEDSSLGARELVGPESLGYGAFPDGFTFDSQGNIWVTLVARNAIVVIDQEGELHTLFEEVNEVALKNMVDAIAAGNATREMMAACYGPTLKLPSSLAFGGPDKRTVYIGSVAGTSLMSFRSPVAG